MRRICQTIQEAMVGRSSILREQALASPRTMQTRKVTPRARPRPKNPKSSHRAVKMTQTSSSMRMGVGESALSLKPDGSMESSIMAKSVVFSRMEITAFAFVMALKMP